MQQRKDEILAKKAKLAELKRQRELRQKEFSQRGQVIEESSQSTARTPPRNENRQELERLIEGLVGEGRGSPARRDSRTTSPSGRGSRPSSILSTKQLSTEPVDQNPSTSSGQSQIRTTSISTQTLDAGPVSVNYDFTPAPKEEVVSYSKGIQTTEPWSLPPRDRSVDGFSDSDPDDSSALRKPKTSKRPNRRQKEREEELRQNLRREIEEELKTVKDPTANDLLTQSTQPKFPSRTLTEDELKAVTSSEDFLDFVERSSKVIERALDQDYDLLADYSLNGLTGLDEDEDEGYASSRGKKGRRIKEIAHFYDERWSKKRMVSDINFSSKFPELLLASYTKNPSAPQDPSGLIQVWNLHLHSRPEYTFHSTSDILTAQFSPFHPSLLLGGTYSGQVLLWDTRSRSPLPVQKTPLTGASFAGHTHPVYSLSLTGTQNANSIISCSTDGVLCAWSIDMLAQPQEYVELTAPLGSAHKTDDLAPTCIAFPPADPTSFLVGTEEGSIYPCHRYDRAGAKAGVDPRLRYKGHVAPVMSLDFHPARGPLDLSDLVLTSSLDWTVKLWRVKASSSTSAVGTSGAIGGATTQDVAPVAEFGREDVVYDARWAPHRPGVFALCDGSGSVEVWDLLTDTEVPAARVMVGSGEGAAVKGGGIGVYAAKSLNKVRWEEKEGRRLGTGGASGVVSVLEVGGELSGEGVRAEEWNGVKRLVGRMAQQGKGWVAGDL